MNNIKKFAKEKNISIRKLASLSGVDRTYITNLAAGRRDNPSKKVMNNISSALGKEVNEVFFSN